MRHIRAVLVMFVCLYTKQGGRREGREGGRGERAKNLPAPRRNTAPARRPRVGLALLLLEPSIAQMMPVV